MLLLKSESMRLTFPFLSTSILCKVRRFEWKITEGVVEPDGHQIQSILINEKFPGPSIRAVEGDQVVVRVTNLLQRGFTFHWHGIKQKGSVEMDGVPFVTQLPIPPKGSYLYNFTVESSGTYFYHAHTGMDSEQAFGALVVKDTKKTWDSIVKYNRDYHYHHERVLLLTEWWHKTPEEARKQVTQLPFSGVPGSETNLINGRAYDHKDGPHVIKVVHGMRYRLRLIGATGMSMLNFRIPGHKFTVIEVEGTLVEPKVVDHVDINSGQRISVILHANQPIDNYPGSISTPFISDGAFNGVFVLKYKRSKSQVDYRKVLPPKTTKTRFPDFSPTGWYKKHPGSHFYKVPQKVDKEIYLATHLSNINGLPVHTMNEVTPAPLKGVMWDNIKNKVYQKSNTSYDVMEGDNVQIIMEDLVYRGRSCPGHPWHLHGHSFFEVAHGEGFYNKRSDRKRIQSILRNHPNPILRDTFTLYPPELNSQSSRPTIKSPENSKKSNHYRSCGWYAIRFKADNPGSWMFHCHVTHHMLMGMTTIINVLPKNQ